MTGRPGANAATFEAAGLVCRVECAYAKPILWVNELHPAFRSTRAPDVVVTFVYDDAYWSRELPWIAPDRLLDAPVFIADAGEGVMLRAAYYDAEIDVEHRRVVARMAGGFGVGGMLRALYAALLPCRGACLVRASSVFVDDGAVLVCDGDEEGDVALVTCGDDVVVEPTPFHHGTTRVRERGRRVVGLGGQESRPVDAAAQLLSRVITIDHSTGTVERVLDVITRLVAGLPTKPDMGVVGAHR